MTNSAIININQARILSGLDLVSARDVELDSGVNYQAMERDSESNTHKLGRNEGIKYFTSIGYSVYPSSVGISGEFTLADFFAVRDGRNVFVEVLTDGNIVEETFKRKGALKKYGELCFILLSGTKRSEEKALMVRKEALAAESDVLWCRLNGYAWQGVVWGTKLPTVAFKTTKEAGISAGIRCEKKGKKVLVTVSILNEPYKNPEGVQISYCVLDNYYHYREIFLEVMEVVAASGRWRATRHFKRHQSRENALKRNAGLSFARDDGEIAFRLRTVGESAVFVLEKAGPVGLSSLIGALRQRGFNLQFSQAELLLAESTLAKQCESVSGNV